MDRSTAIEMLLAGRFHEWNDFRNSNPDYVPDLSGADFRGISFFGGLERKDFPDTGLVMEMFIRPIPHRAILDDCDFSEANLTHNLMAGASIKRARFQDTMMTDALLPEADLREARFQGSYMRNVDLRGADLRAVRIEYSELTEARMQYANMSEAVIVNLEDSMSQFSKRSSCHVSAAR